MDTILDVLFQVAMDTILAVLFLILVTSTPSRQVSGTCAEITQGRLHPLVNCTLNINILVCGDITTDTNVPNVTAFNILQQVNISQTDIKFCIGFINFTRESLIREIIYSFRQTVAFDSDLAIGVVTADRKCWENERSTRCLSNVSILEDILELGVFKYYPDCKEFWNFNSTLYGRMMGWFQTLHVDIGVRTKAFLSADWITHLQNSSIRDLRVRWAQCTEDGNGFLLNEMPYLEKLHLSWVCIKEFNNDSFTGTPNLQQVRLVRANLTSIPKMITRLPNLRSFDIPGNLIVGFVIIEDETLPQLYNLESLNMAGNRLNPVLDKFPILNNLKTLGLRDCKLMTLDKDAFKNISLLERLDLKENDISYIHNETFISLHKLKLLDLSFNQLVSMPVIYDCSLVKLELSFNNLTGFTNPSLSGTTIDTLSVSHNKIYEWNDVDMFSYKSRENVIAGDRNIQEEENSFIMNKSANYNITHENSYDKTLQTYRYILLNSMSNRNKWVRFLDVSGNRITRLTDVMLKSMDGVETVKLGGKSFDCDDCTIPEFQKWINTTKTKIIDVTDIRCYEPRVYEDWPVIIINFNLESCIIKVTNYFLLAGIPLGIGVLILVIMTLVFMRFRSEIVYIMHLHRVRKQKTAVKYEDFNFDAFVCYSSRDRRFVLTALVPLLENCPERYKLCLHERDFVMGSDIIENIVRSIEHSRKIILILSPNFIDSKWCIWELEKANIKMLDDDQQFFILIQVARMDPDTIPRHLKFYMDTRTFLIWPEGPSKSAVQEMRRQLKKSLGKSIYENTNEHAALVSMET